jgi:hypothetical protein
MRTTALRQKPPLGAVSANRRQWAQRLRAWRKVKAGSRRGHQPNLAQIWIPGWTCWRFALVGRSWSGCLGGEPAQIRGVNTCEVSRTSSPTSGVNVVFLLRGVGLIAPKVFRRMPREIRRPALTQRSLTEDCEPDHTSTVQLTGKMGDGRTCITSVALEAAWQLIHVLT